MSIVEFGQKIELTITDGEDDIVFQTTDLKVVFDIRNIRNYSRAKFEIWNLDSDTVDLIANGERYVSLKVGLHDAPLETIAYKMFVSNSLEVLDVPNSITSLYCFSGIKKTFYEVQIDIDVPKTNLKGMVEAITNAAGFNRQVDLIHFTDDQLAYIPPKPVSKQKGSLESCLSKVCSMYSANYYTEGEDIKIMHKPVSKNVAETDLFNAAGDVILDTSSMRSNPKIGPATLSIVSNLDTNIKVTAVLNIANLITAATDTDQAVLEVSKDFLKGKVAGFAKYQTLAVQHKGSNFSKEWTTFASATSPKAGTDMPITTWFK